MVVVQLSLLEALCLPLLPLQLVLLSHLGFSI
uniref:Uncharacterized protein n=1 Tax=Arundo donax TaxID=35708 RepID=A0A0A9BFM3_ARUDO